MWLDFVLSSFYSWKRTPFLPRFRMSERRFFSEFCITLQLHQPQRFAPSAELGFTQGYSSFMRKCGNSEGAPWPGMGVSKVASAVASSLVSSRSISARLNYIEAAGES